MLAFASLDEMDRFAKASGVGVVGRALLRRSTRMGVGFEAEQVTDAGLAPGASKLGGEPDLPAGMTWPTNAATDMAQVRAPIAAQRAKALQYLETSPYWAAESSRDYRDATDRQQAALGRPFPLGFLAQIDLSAMAAFKGRAPWPARGFLWVFAEIRGTISSLGISHRPNVRLFHADVAAGDLRRHSVPDAVKAVFLDGLGDVGGYGADAVTTEATALVRPRDVWTPSPYERPYRQIELSQAQPAPPRLDVFGGWESPIQAPFRDDLIAVRRLGSDGRATSREGWVHVLSIAGEQQGAWSVTNWNDGDLYVMIHESDLRAGRFDQVRYTYQFT